MEVSHEKFLELLTKALVVYVRIPKRRAADALGLCCQYGAKTGLMTAKIYNPLLAAAREEMSFFRRCKFDVLLGDALGKKPRAQWTNMHIAEATFAALRRIYNV